MTFAGLFVFRDYSVMSENSDCQSALGILNNNRRSAQAFKHDHGTSSLECFDLDAYHARTSTIFGGICKDSRHQVVAPFRISKHAIKNHVRLREDMALSEQPQLEN